MSRADNGDAAVGLIATYAALKPIANKYGPLASQLIYISPDPPHSIITKPVDGDELILIMAFAKPALLAAAERIGPNEGIARGAAAGAASLRPAGD
jgi:hypothetical protein